MGVILNGIVTPAKAGFLVEMWWGTPAQVGAWETTNSKGKVQFTPTATSWPVTFYLVIPAEQTVNGVKYEGYTSEKATLYDTQKADFYLYPEPKVPIGIPTTLTISAPATVKPEETFNIIGQLTRNDTGEALPNMSISVSYNGKPLGSVLTDMQGVYTIPASIPTTGTYTLKAEFLGTAEYAASKSTANTMVTTPLEAAIKIAGSMAVGLALTIYSLRK